MYERPHMLIEGDPYAFCVASSTIFWASTVKCVSWFPLRNSHFSIDTATSFVLHQSEMHCTTQMIVFKINASVFYLGDSKYE